MFVTNTIFVSLVVFWTKIDISFLFSTKLRNSDSEDSCEDESIASPTGEIFMKQKSGRKSKWAVEQLDDFY